MKHKRSIAWNYCDEIIDLYINELASLSELGRKYKVAPLTIKNILQHYSVPIRSSAEQTAIKNRKYRHLYAKYTYNTNYFKAWTSNMAYIVGFLLGDGSLYQNRLKISLQRGDKELLEAIKKEFEYTGPIHDYTTILQGKTYKYSELHINCYEWVKDLNRLNIVENKQHIVSLPNVPIEYELDLVRGFFDADGSAVKGKYIRTSFGNGSYQILFDVMLILSRYGLQHKKIYKEPNKNLYTLVYSNLESKLFYNAIYSHLKDNDLYLQRKKDVYLEHFNITD